MNCGGIRPGMEAAIVRDCPWASGRAESHAKSAHDLRRALGTPISARAAMSGNGFRRSAGISRRSCGHDSLAQHPWTARRPDAGLHRGRCGGHELPWPAFLGHAREWVLRFRIVLNTYAGYNQSQSGLAGPEIQGWSLDGCNEALDAWLRCLAPGSALRCASG